MEAVRISRAISGIGLLLGRAAVALVSAQGWFKLGYARASDLAHERFGRTGRWLADQAALGRAVERWPQLGRALTGDDGAQPLGKVAATLLGRVASDTTIEDWIRLARRITVRKLKALIRSGSNGLEEALSCALGGNAPPVVEDPDGRASEDCAEQWLVSLDAPAAAVAAFDETLVAYRAVIGGEATVASFVEALVGEALSGPVPFDASYTEVAADLGVAALEERFERATDSWSALATESDVRVGSTSNAGIEAVSVFSAPELAQLDALAAVAGKGDVVELERQLRELIRIEDALERRLGQVLSRMGEQGAWSRLRFANVDHYGEQRLGLQRTAVYHRTRLSRALRRFPELRKAYEAGAIGQEAALIVVRILEQGPHEPELERAWVERAKEATVKRLRDEARAISRTAALGGFDRSCSTVFDRAVPALHDAIPAWQRHGSEFRERVHSTAAPGAAMAHGAEEPGRDPGPPFIADRRTGIADALVLGDVAPGDAPAEAGCGETAFGRSSFENVEGFELGNRGLQADGSFRAALSNSTLGQGPIGAQDAAVLDHSVHTGARFPLDDASWHRSLHHSPGELRARVLALCERALGSGDPTRPSLPCSDGFFKRRLPAELARDFLAAIEAARAALEQQARDEGLDGRGSSSQVRASLRAARMFSARCRRVPAWVGLVSMLEEFVETWDPPKAGTSRRTHSAKSIYAREGWRCFAPGCTSRRNLENHHVVYRSRGGELNDPSNQVCLCRYHHQRGEHGDLASCRGTAPLGLTFRLGPAAPGCSEWFRNERRVQPP